MSAYFSEYLIDGNHKVWLHNHKKEKPEFHVQDHRSWSGRGGPWYPQDFGRSVNPIQTWGQIMPTTLLHFPGFSGLPTALLG